MTIDLNDQATRDRVAQMPEGAEILRSFDALPGTFEHMRMEAQLSPGIWTDMTPYLKAAEIGPARPRITKRAARLVHGPNRAARTFARKVRMRELPQRLEMTGGTGNLMVNICRLATARSRDRRADASYQRPADPTPRHPNRRLDAFGMTVRGDWDNGGGVVIRGGTAKQQACYRRAVERWMAHA